MNTCIQYNPVVRRKQKTIAKNMITRDKRSLSYKGWQNLIEEAVQKTIDLIIHISVSTVDKKNFARMDNALHQSVHTSRRKTFIPIGYAFPSGYFWYEYTKEDPCLMHGISHKKNLTHIGGGSPIFVRGVMIGTLGTNGSHYTNTEQCVSAALQHIKTL